MIGHDWDSYSNGAAGSGSLARLLATVLALTLASTAAADDYAWCPNGGKWVDRLDCLTLEKSRTDDTATWVSNTCPFEVIVHTCRTKPVFDRYCGNPRVPNQHFRLEPGYRDLWGTDFHYWVVSCE